MRVHDLICEQLVSAGIEEVFAFFDRPENLAVITPPSLGFVVLTPSPITMKQGALIDYTVRGLPGLRMRWTTLISCYEPPFKFVDEQLKGPYSFWHHTHTFEETGEGTVIRDHVRYVLPFGPLGEIAHALFVKRQLEGIFAYRQKVIEDRYGTPPRKVVAA